MRLVSRLFAPELRSNPEYQSAWVRLSLWIFAVGYIGLGALGWEVWLDGQEITQFTYFFSFFGSFLILFLGLLISVYRRPDWPTRRFFALAVDVAGASFAIFLTKEAISPFYLLYIWLFISYGTRYGQLHLTVASIMSVLAYSAVLIALEQWQKHTFEAVFFLLLLVMLPLYQHSLIRKVHLARRQERLSRHHDP